MENKEFILKPCPFCGGAARLLSEGNGHSVRCPHCGAETEIDLPLAEAVARWNKRERPPLPKYKAIRIYIPEEHEHFFTEEYARTYQSIRVSFDMPMELYSVLCKYAVGHKNHPDDAARLIVMRDCCRYIGKIDTESSEEVSDDA